MALTIDSSIALVRTTLAGLSALRNVPDIVPENANVFPFAAVFFGGGGSVPQSSGWKQGLYTITVEIHTSRRDLPKAVMQLEDGLIDAVENAIHGLIASGSNIFTFTNMNWSPLQTMRWGDVDTIGYILTIDGVKVRAAIA